ncbi:unnamed protein product [Amoebophrya sp. A120]|nr:unnamed protein product [Amoebophrya sp. A120]|eukprot:GSA120T00006662001.1
MMATSSSSSSSSAARLPFIAGSNFLQDEPSACKRANHCKEVSIVCVDVLSETEDQHAFLRDAAVEYMGSKLLQCLGTGSLKVMVSEASDVGVMEVGAARTSNPLALSPNEVENNNDGGPDNIDRLDLQLGDEAELLPANDSSELVGDVYQNLAMVELSQLVASYGPRKTNDEQQLTGKRAKATGAHPHIVAEIDCDAVRKVNVIERNAAGRSSVGNPDLVTDALILAQTLIEQHIGKRAKTFSSGSEIVFFLTKATALGWGGPEAVDAAFGDDAFENIIAQLRKFNILVKLFVTADEPNTFGVEGSAAWGLFSQKYRQQASSHSLATLNAINSNASPLGVEIVELTAAVKSQQLSSALRVLREVKPTVKTKCDLEIGLDFNEDGEPAKKLKLPVWIYAKTQKKLVPTLKRQKAVQAEGVTTRWEKVYKKEDTEEYVDFSELIKGFWYGGEIVPIGEADLHMFNFGAPKCLEVVCSVKSNTIKPEWYLGLADYVIPEKDCDAVLFSCLAKEMLETDHSLLVRYVGRDKSKPRLAVLEAARNPVLVKHDEKQRKKKENERKNLPHPTLDGRGLQAMMTTNDRPGVQPPAGGGAAAASSSSLKRPYQPGEDDGPDELDDDFVAPGGEVDQDVAGGGHAPAFASNVPMTTGNVVRNSAGSGHALLADASPPPMNRYVLYLSLLPFCEDMREWPFPKINTKISAAQQNLVDDLVDQMTITPGTTLLSSKKPTDADGSAIAEERQELQQEDSSATSLCLPFSSLDEIRSGMLSGFHDCLLKRILVKQAGVEEDAQEAADVEDFVNPLWKMDAGFVDAERFREHFDLTKREQIGGKKKQFWLNDE